MKTEYMIYQHNEKWYCEEYSVLDKERKLNYATVSDTLPQLIKKVFPNANAQDVGRIADYGVLAGSVVGKEMDLWLESLSIKDRLDEVTFHHKF